MLATASVPVEIQKPYYVLVTLSDQQSKVSAVTRVQNTDEWLMADSIRRLLPTAE
jgi:hypothetical protein